MTSALQASPWHLAHRDNGFSSTDVLNCHRPMCRNHASGLRTRAKVCRDWLTVKREDRIKFHASSPGEHNGICLHYGSSLYTKFDASPEGYGFPLGTLNTNPEAKVP